MDDCMVSLLFGISSLITKALSVLKHALIIRGLGLKAFEILSRL